jgi:hypothetical protein
MYSHIVIVDKVVLIRSKCKLWLLNLSFIKVDHVVAVYYCASVFLTFCFIGQANKDITLLVELPSVQDYCFHLCYVRLDWDGSCKAIYFINSAFSFNDLVCFELKGVIMSGLIPTHCWIVICLLRHVFISPFSLLRFIDCHSLRHFSILHIYNFKRIREVSKSIPVIIIPSFLFEAKIFGFWKCLDICLIWLFIHELMREIWEFVSF